MNKLLREGSPIIRFFEKIFDVIFLNILFLLCSLPIVTIGVSWSALLSICDDRNCGINKPLIKSFIDKFKKNFLSSMRISLVLVILVMMLILLGLSGVSLFLPLILILLIIGIVISSYGFMYSSKYNDSVFKIIRTSLLLFLFKPLNGLLVIALNTVVIIFSISSAKGFITTIYLGTFIGFTILAIINSRIIGNAFRAYEKNYK